MAEPIRMTREQYRQQFGQEPPAPTAAPAAPTQQPVRMTRAQFAQQHGEVPLKVYEAAKRHNVNPSLAMAMARAESNNNPQAVSPAGAVGVMQLMPATAKELGVNPFDADQNIDGGVRYIKSLLERSGNDIDKALEYYNFGMGNVDAGKPLPNETVQYKQRVKEYMGIGQQKPITLDQAPNPAAFAPQERGMFAAIGDAKAQERLATPAELGNAMSEAAAFPVAAVQTMTKGITQIPPFNVLGDAAQVTLDTMNPTTPPSGLERGFNQAVTSAATEGNAAKRVVAGGALDAGMAFGTTLATAMSDRKTADQIAADKSLLSEVSTETDKQNLGPIGQVLRPAAQNAASTLIQSGVSGAVGGFPAIMAQMMTTTYDDGLRQGQASGLQGEELVNYARRQSLYEGAVMGAFQAAGLPGLEKLPFTAISPEAVKTVKTSLAPALKRTLLAYGEELPEETITWALQTADAQMSNVGEKMTTGDYVKQWLNLALETSLSIGASRAPDIGRGVRDSVVSDFGDAAAQGIREAGREMQDAPSWSTVAGVSPVPAAEQPIASPMQEQPVVAEANPEVVAPEQQPVQPEQPKGKVKLVYADMPTEQLQSMLEQGGMTKPVRTAIEREMAKRETQPEAIQPAPESGTKRDPIPIKTFTGQAQPGQQMMRRPQPVEPTARDFDAEDKELNRAIESALNQQDLVGASKLYSKRKALTQERLLESNGGKHVGVEASNSDGTRWAVLVPEMSGKPGQFRLQIFDRRGLSGHQTYNSAEDALREMADQGYRTPDKGAMDRLAQTKEFQDGNESLKAAQDSWKMPAPQPEQAVVKDDLTTGQEATPSNSQATANESFRIWEADSSESGLRIEFLRDGNVVGRKDVPDVVLEMIADTPQQYRDNAIARYSRMSTDDLYATRDRIRKARFNTGEAAWSDPEGNVIYGSNAYSNAQNKTYWEPLNEKARAAKARIEKIANRKQGRVNTPAEARGKDIYVFARSANPDNAMRPVAGPFYTHQEAMDASTVARQRMDSEFDTSRVDGFSYGTREPGDSVDVLYPDLRSPEGSSPFTTPTPGALPEPQGAPTLKQRRDAILDEKEAIQDERFGRGEILGSEASPLEILLGLVGISGGTSVDGGETAGFLGIKTALDMGREDVATVLVEQIEADAASAERQVPGVEQDHPKYQSILETLREKANQARDRATRARRVFELNRDEQPSPPSKTAAPELSSNAGQLPAPTPGVLPKPQGNKADSLPVIEQTDKFNETLEKQVEFSPPSQPSLQNARSVPDLVVKKGGFNSVSGGKEEGNILDKDRSKKRFEAIGYQRQEIDLPEDMNERVSNAYGASISNVKSLWSPSWLGAHFHGGVAISSSVKGVDRGRVLAHELGHASHSLLGDKVNSDPVVLAELQAIEQSLYPGLRETVSSTKNADVRFFNYLLSADEIIAEFNVDRITNPEKARQIAPKLTALLESVEKDKNLVADRKVFPTFFGTTRETKNRLLVKGLDARQREKGFRDVTPKKMLQYLVTKARDGRNAAAEMWLRALKREGVSPDLIRRAVEMGGNQKISDAFNEMFPAEQPQPPSKTPGLLNTIGKQMADIDAGTAQAKPDKAFDRLTEGSEPAPQKQPWEMTREEFVKQSAAIPASGGFAARANAKIAKPYHRELVNQALRDGQPVPPAVLADYPDLAAKYGEKDSPTAAQSQMTPEHIGNAIAFLTGAPQKGTGKPRISFKTNVLRNAFQKGFESGVSKPDGPFPDLPSGLSPKDQAYNGALRDGMSQGALAAREFAKLTSAIEARANIPVRDLEKFGMKLPDGYVKVSDMAFFREASDARQSALSTAAQPSEQTGQDRRGLSYKGVPVSLDTVSDKSGVKGKDKPSMGVRSKEYVARRKDGTPVDRFTIYQKESGGEWIAYKGDTLSQSIHDMRDQAARLENSTQPLSRTQTLQTAAQNLAAIEGKAEPVVSEGQNKAFDRLVGKDAKPTEQPVTTPTLTTVKDNDGTWMVQRDGETLSLGHKTKAAATKAMKAAEGAPESESVTDKEARVLKSLSSEGSFVDEVALANKISVRDALTTLTLMELKGQVKQLSGKRFAPKVDRKPEVSPIPVEQQAKGKPKSFAGKEATPSWRDIDKSKASPVIRQFIEAKEQASDALLMFRMGDFYELFYEDAQTAADVMGLPLTRRGEALMAGFPVRKLEDYVKFATDNGMKVAVVDQVTDPKESAGVTKREVTQTFPAEKDASPTPVAKQAGTEMQQPAEQAIESPIATEEEVSRLFDLGTKARQKVKEAESNRYRSKSKAARAKAEKAVDDARAELMRADIALQKARESRKPRPVVVTATPEEEAFVAADKKKVKEATGFKPSQEQYVAQQLREHAEEATPERPIKIVVPQDGSVTVVSPEAASAVHQRLTGKPIEGIAPLAPLGARAKSESSKLRVESGFPANSVQTMNDGSPVTIEEQVADIRRQKGQGPQKAETSIDPVEALRAIITAGSKLSKDAYDRAKPHLRVIYESAKNATDFIAKVVRDIGEHARAYAKRFAIEYRRLGNSGAAINPFGAAGKVDANRSEYPASGPTREQVTDDEGDTPYRVPQTAMVRMIQKLLGRNPEVVKRFPRKPERLGVFMHGVGDTTIRLRADLAIGERVAEQTSKSPFDEQEKSDFLDAVAEELGVDPEQVVVTTDRERSGNRTIHVMNAYLRDPDYAGRVMAHELGHLIDYLPDETMSRGNVLGRIAKLQRHFKTSMAPEPESLEQPFTKEERAKWRKEAAIDAARDYGPFEKGDDRKGFYTSAYYRYRLIEEAENRGLLLENKIKSKLMDAWDVSYPGVRDELKALTHWWNPFDANDNEKYTQYRYSAKELYAEAMSVLLNNPQAFKMKAPEFSRGFFAYLERNPEVKALYEQIQTELHDGKYSESVVDRVEEMQRLGDAKRKAKNKRENPPLWEQVQKFWRDMKITLIDEQAAVYRTGSEILDPYLWLRDMKHINSTQHQFQRDIHKMVLNPLKKFGMDGNQLGLYMFFRRTSTERKYFFNPLGVTEPEAETGMKDMEAKYGPEAMAALKKAADEYYDLRKEYIFPELRGSRLLSPELLKMIEDNENYATFNVIKYIEEFYSTKSNADNSRIFQQTGTFEEVENVFTATMLKDMALIRQAVKNKAKMTVIDVGKELGEVEDAPMSRRSGGEIVYKEPTDPTKQLMKYSLDGKLQAVIIDRAIALAYETNLVEMNNFTKIVQNMWVSGWFRRSLTTWNPGFGPVAFMKDVATGYKNTPGVNPIPVINSLRRTWQDAYIDAVKGESTMLTKFAYKNNMLIPNLAYDAANQADYETEVERMAHIHGLAGEKNINKNVLLRVLTKAKDGVETWNLFFERWSKAANAYRMINEGYIEREGVMRVSERVRTMAGTPDALAGGRWRRPMNGLFLFSNINIQGLRSTYKAAKEQKLAYMFKVAAVDIAPKLLMRGLQLGMLGYLLGLDEEEDWLKRFYNTVPDSDLMNYTVIPLGFTKDGTPTYIPLPSDHTGIFFGGLAWATTRPLLGERIDIDEIGRTAINQAPAKPDSLAPLPAMMLDLMLLASGVSPYDTYRGMPAIDRGAMAAGVVAPAMRGEVPEAVKQAVEYEARKYFSTVINFSSDETKDDMINEIGRVPVIGPIMRRYVRASDKGVEQRLRREKSTLMADEAARSERLGSVLRDAVESAGKDANKITVWRKLAPVLREEKLLTQTYGIEDALRRFKDIWIMTYGTPEEKLKATTPRAIIREMKAND